MHHYSTFNKTPIHERCACQTAQPSKAPSKEPSHCHLMCHRPPPKRVYSLIYNPTFSPLDRSAITATLSPSTNIVSPSQLLNVQRSMGTVNRQAYGHSHTRTTTTNTSSHRIPLKIVSTTSSTQRHRLNSPNTYMQQQAVQPHQRSSKPSVEASTRHGQDSQQRRSTSIYPSPPPQPSVIWISNDATHDPPKPDPTTTATTSFTI